MSVNAGSVISVYAGTLVVVTGTFTAADGKTLVDPTTVELRYSQGVTGYPVTKWTFPANLQTAGTGIYQAELDTTGLPGIWAGVWQGTGVCQVEYVFTFNVLALPF